MAAIEEPIAPVVAPATEDVKPSDGGKAKKVKDTKAKKKSAPKKVKSASSHPSYFEMISSAITTLKERHGSSQYAIQKFIEEKYKQLPANFRKLLLVSLRKLVADGRLVKVKGSFKLSSAPKAETAPAKKPKAAVVAKPKAKAAGVKPKAKAAPAKAKTAAKPKSAPVKKAKATSVKAKAAAPVKAKAVGTKRKAVADVKPKAAKVAKTAAKSTPAKKAAVAKPKKAVKKTPVKSVKPKSVKSPVRAMPKRGKK